MRASRRDTLISAAQVALHYGGYKLDDAMALSRDERELLLAVAFDAREQQWEQLETILGTSWDVRQLAGALLDKPASDKPRAMPNKIRIPLLLAAAPDFFKAMTDEYKKKYQTMLNNMQEAGSTVIEIGTLSPEEARELYKSIGGMIASAPTPTESRK